MKFLAPLLAVLVAVAAPAAASAQVIPGLYGAQFRQDRAREEAREGQRVSLSDVVRRLQNSRPGRMLGANESNRGGRTVYIVRWEYPGGRVADIIVDARTGQILGEN